MGMGMSQEIDSNMVGGRPDLVLRRLHQDKNSNVT